MRTPAMTVEEAEAILGPQGSLMVTVENRGTVRKWLTAQGLNSAYVGTMHLHELAMAYNARDMLKWRDAAAHYAYHASVKAGDTSEDGATSYDVATTDSFEAGDVAKWRAAKAQTEATPAKANDDMAKLREILLAGYKPEAALNEERVREIANEAIQAGGVKITRIEVVQDNGSVRSTEGHVHPQFEVLVKAMRARQEDGFHSNIMLVGPTGSGKTHAAKAAAELLGLEFFTNGAVTMDHQVLGFIDAAGKYHTTALRNAFGKPAVYLADELDSSDNTPLLALAGCLANGHQAFPDAMVTRHRDSVIIAAGNTWGLGATSEFVGRNRIDGAIRSRFPIRIYWGYDEVLETAISGNIEWAKRVQRARAKALQGGLKVTIDPRMTMAGAGLIAAGFSMKEAANMTYLADLTDAQKAIVEV